MLRPNAETQPHMLLKGCIATLTPQAVAAAFGQPSNLYFVLIACAAFAAAIVMEIVEYWNGDGG